MTMMLLKDNVETARKEVESLLATRRRLLEHVAVVTETLRRLSRIYRLRIDLDENAVTDWGVLITAADADNGGDEAEKSSGKKC